MPWLLRDGRVLASAELACTRAERRRGLLGRDGIDGVMVIDRARSVHTIGMRFPIDVAHVADDGTVLRIATVVPNRVGRPVPGSRRVIEAEAGSFAHWGLAPGDVVEIRQGDEHADDLGGHQDDQHHRPEEPSA